MLKGDCKTLPSDLEMPSRGDSPHAKNIFASLSGICICLRGIEGRPQAFQQKKRQKKKGTAGVVSTTKRFGNMVISPPVGDSLPKWLVLNF